MIFPLTGLLIGVILGAVRAQARGGNTLDMMQWATVYGLVFFVLGMFVLVFIERAAV